MRFLIFAALVCYAYGVAVPVTCKWDDCDEPCGGGSRRCDRSNGKIWYHQCHVQDCDPFPGCGKADIVYVLDSSASIGEKNWWILKQFLVDVSKGLTIGPKDSRIAAVTYSDEATTRWGLKEYEDSADKLEKAIWELDWEAGVTYTGDGLRLAKNIMESARPNVKQIVIVVTDGVSNVKVNETQQYANALHAAGVEVFTIGIGEIDPAECRGIASDPDDYHFKNVTGYNTLVAITNTIVNDTCESASRTECGPWAPLTECLLTEADAVCGLGHQDLKQTCKFYMFDGAQAIEREAIERRVCDIECIEESTPPTTTTQEPTTTTTTTQEPTTPKPKDRCARCDFNEHGVGYLPVEENCHMFIQCERKLDGTFIEHKKSCNTRYWRQSIKNCDNKIDEGSCTSGEVVADESVSEEESDCDKIPGPSKSEYIWIVGNLKYTMPCAPGTIFYADSCRCDHGQGDEERRECDSSLLLHFPFNENYNDISCNNAAGTPKGNMRLDDGAAFFDGHSRVEVGFLDNWFADHPTPQITVTLWFKFNGENGNLEGLFTNGDCIDDASLRLSVEGGSAQGQVIAKDRDAVNFDGSAGASSRAFEKNEWTFVALVKTDWDVKYYVNGKAAGSKSVSGNIANTQCPANIGFSGLNNEDHFFNGHIDDVRVYKKIVWEHDLKKMYRDGRQ